jgi:hypothetical protein
MAVLLSCPHALVTLDPTSRVVVHRRTALPFAEAIAYQAHVEDVIATLASVDRHRHALLVDLRDAPMRTDPDFELVARYFREEVMRGFVRTAVLVRTHVGRLQIARHSSEDGVMYPQFLDEREAWRYLTERPSARP